MSIIQVWVHCVWATKDRMPWLVDEIRPNVFDHIRVNGREKGIYVDHIGGYLEHLHALVSLGSGQSVDHVAQMIKGESSHWINKENLTSAKFGWQDDYFAESVSVRSLPAVRKYIRDQESHHRKVSFDDEWNLFHRRRG